MKTIAELALGYNDAENYRRREHKAMFNKIFVKDSNLERLMQPSTYFLIGEKGTGKTAYAVYLANNQHNNTQSFLKYIRETEYQKLVELKLKHQLELSDYTSIWYVIVLLLLAKSLTERELDELPFSKSKKTKALLTAIDEFYLNAFSPEIVYALNFVDQSHVAAKLVAKHLELGGEIERNVSFSESRFQINLMFLKRNFEDALSLLKLKMNHFLFIDGIDIRPGLIPYKDYHQCVKGLANAIWNLNNDFFPSVKDPKGTFKVVLLIRPDIFDSIGLQNQTNKVFDNSVYLDWRTTYNLISRR